jgi:hypothetical protein
VSRDGDGGRCAAENHEIDQTLREQQNVVDVATLALHGIMLSLNAESRRKVR